MSASARRSSNFSMTSSVTSSRQDSRVQSSVTDKIAGAYESDRRKRGGGSVAKDKKDVGAALND
jgi:hypothetical protein